MANVTEVLVGTLIANGVQGVRLPGDSLEGVTDSTSIHPKREHAQRMLIV
jgi:hypothetical protein